MFHRLHRLHLIRFALLAAVVVLSSVVSRSAGAAQPRPMAMLAPALQGRINLNTASATQLQLLPGVGPATAAKIIAYRERRPFQAIKQLMRIKGIGRKRFAAVRSYIAVEGETTLRVAVP